MTGESFGHAVFIVLRAQAPDVVPRHASRSRLDRRRPTRELLPTYHYARGNNQKQQPTTTRRLTASHTSSGAHPLAVERRAIAPHRPNSLAQSSLKPQARSKACGPQNQASRRDGLARGGGSDQATAAAPHAMSGSLHAWLVRETLITHETRDVLSLI